MSLGQLVASLRAFSLRFIFISVIPTMLLILTILLLVFSGAPHRAPDAAIALHRLRHLTANDLVLIAFVGGVIGIILNPMQFAMIQILEGHWGPSRLGIIVAALATKRYDRRFEIWDKGRKAALNKDPDDEIAARAGAIYERSLEALPQPERLMPTRLGNVLRAAEDFAGDRYALDAIQVIPRLYPQLSPQVASPLDDSRLQLDVAVRLCMVWLIASSASVGILARFPEWLWVSAVIYMLSWLSYRAACAAAEGYGAMLAVAIDLHRFDFLEALHQPLPSSYKQEVSNNTVLTAILEGRYIGDKLGELPKSRYVHPVKRTISGNGVEKP